MQLGRELEKDVGGNPRRFWARIKAGRSKGSMSHINDDNGQVLVDEVEVIERWKEHFEELYGGMDRTDQEVPCGKAVEEDDLEIYAEEVRCVKR